MKKVFAVLFIIWFIFSIGLFFVFKDTFRIFVNFGQYFVVLSLVALSERDSIMPVIHLTLGLIIMIVPFVMSVLPKFSDLFGIDLFSVIIGFSGLGIGYILIFLSRGKDNRLFNKLYLGSITSFVVGLFMIIWFCLK